MRRREFIGLVGGAAAWPLAARAQKAGKIWRVGYLNPGSISGSSATVFDAWKRKLRELGYIEGQNLIIDRRFGEDDFSRLPQIAEDLVATHPHAIVAIATPAVAAVQKATSTIPIVMANIGDPVGSEFIKNLSRPGGNITGTANMTVDYMPKTIELLRELLPGAKRVAALMSANPTHVLLYRTVEPVATAVGIDLLPVIAKTAADLDDAFAKIVSAKCEAVIVFTDATRLQIVPLAAAARLPAIYQIESFVDAGGLISYGSNVRAGIVQTAVYVDKIFRGADPADLPVEQPTVFELRINLKTAKTLGLTIPPTLIARADKVIE
jgi:putative tryptophan/tyrosine transport system substrate-binding protein